MKFKLFKNLYIEATDSLTESQVRNIVLNSISYFTDQLKIEADEIKVLILLSNDYSNDVSKYHFDLSSSKILNGNGIIIPPYFQKEEYKEKDITIVIINYNKFKHLYDLKQRFSIVESIILHELVHWYDMYYAYENLIVEKYGDIFEKRSFGTFEDAVGGIYQNRSEVRAKYYQEKYLLLNKVYDLDIDYISRALTKIDKSERSKTFYTLAHARAQILCWETLHNEGFFNLSSQNLDFILNKKKEILEFESTNSFKNMAELFEVEDFHEYCDEVKPQFE